MIKNLSITNVAVAKTLDVELENGFSVITGETGAGKSSAEFSPGGAVALEFF